MAKNLTYRITAEGIDQFRKDMEAAGDAGTAAFERLKASLPGLGDAVERARQRAEAAKKSLEEAARVDFLNLQAQIDPTAASLARMAQGAETVNTALKAGVIDAEEAEQAHRLLAQRFESGAASGDQFTSKLGTMREALGALGVGLTAGGVVAFARNVIDATAAIEPHAKAVGLASDAYQAYTKSAGDAGVELGTVESALKTFTRSIGEARDGSKSQADAFAELGLTGDALAGGPEAVLPKVATALLKISDVTARARVEADLFGRSGQDVEAALRRWSDPELVANMEKGGKILSEGYVRAAADSKRALGDLFDWITVQTAKLLLPDPAAWARLRQQDTDQRNFASLEPLRTGRGVVMPNAETRTSGIPFASAFEYQVQQPSLLDPKQMQKDAEDGINAAIEEYNRFREDQKAIAAEIGGLWDNFYKTQADEAQATIDAIGAKYDDFAKREAEDIQAGIDEVKAKLDESSQRQAETTQAQLDSWDKIEGNLTEQLRLSGLSREERELELEIMRDQQTLGRDLNAGERERVELLVKARQERDGESQALDKLGNDIVRLVSSLKLGGGGAGAGSAIALLLGTLKGGGGSGLSGANNSPSLGGAISSLFGGGSSSSGGYPFPSSVDVTPRVGTSSSSSFLGQAAPYISGAVQGYQVGSLNLFGGNAQNSSIGGSLGGAVGSILGPIGSVVGSIAGSLLGSLFGPSHPSNYTAVGYFNSDMSSASYGGDKPNQNTSSLAGQATQAVLAEVTQLKNYGISFLDHLKYVAIGEQRSSYYALSNGVNVNTGSIGDAGDLAFKAVKALLSSSSGGSANLRTAISGATSLDDINTRAQFVTQVYDIVSQGAPSLTSFETQMKDLIKSFEDGTAKSREYGLSVAAFTEGFARKFDSDIKMQLLSIQAPMEYAVELWKRDAQARIDTATALNADISQVQQLNAALYAKMNEGALTTLRQFRQTLSFGQGSPLAPGEQLFAAASAYNRDKDAALAGGDVAPFTQSATNYLNLTRGYYGTSEKYGDLYRSVDQVASKLEDKLSAPPQIDFTQMIQSNANNTAVLADKLSAVTEAVSALRDDTRQTQAQMLAIIRRFTA